MLKTPHHLEHLDAVLATFADVTVVQTHRDPQVALASFLSMVAHGRGVFSDTGWMSGRLPATGRRRLAG